MPSERFAAKAQAAWREARTEIGGRTRELLWLAALIFTYSFSYGLIRPPTESLFLRAYGHQRLPEAWLVGILVMLLLVELYARFGVRLGVLRVFAVVAGASVVVLTALLGSHQGGLFDASYALFVWKEVYIILLVETFWTVANLLFRVHAARWIYGLFCATGALTGLGGNLFAAALARRVGSEAVLWFALPVLVAGVFLAVALHARQPLPTQEAPARPSLLAAPALLRRSPYLVWMLALVATTQVVITLIDYEYNGTLAHSFTNVDERTQMIGVIYAAISITELGLQLATGPILRFLGVGVALLAVPALLGSTLVAHLIWPGFALMAVVKVASKALDYSLFRAAKEILYIPLSFRDKTEGKALVDMLVYRSAKGVAYPLFHGLAWLAVLPVAGATLGFVALWVAITVRILTRHRQLASEDQK